MIDKVKDNCTACNACYSKCPADAIQMEPDAEGFLQPVIDMGICTRCNLCEQVCPVLNPYNILDTFPPHVFAAWSKDEEVRINSSSGGIFSELAKHILKNDGHVIGAQYKTDHTVEHVSISNLRDLPLLRQSKYLQSEIAHTFREVETLVKTGTPILFCGTPCQAAGLLSYLGQEYVNLTVCDFICHGVSSPLVYKLYLTDIEEKYGAPVETIQFRNKDIGWNQSSTYIQFENGRIYTKDHNRDPYMYGYLMNIYLRTCCYECKFKKIPRISDISLGDFWGIGNTRPHLDQNKGTSMVFTNTKKGLKLFCAIRECIESEACTFEEALNGNHTILKSVSRPKYRKKYFSEIHRSGAFIPVIENYQQKGIPRPMIRRAISYLKRLFHI